MRNVIIACRTLRDELNLALATTGCQAPVTWLEADYHNDPNQLRARLQEEVDGAPADTENILLAYGCCGTGLVGLKATGANLVIPRTEDCISMLLSRRGETFTRPKATYFLTRGWMEGAKSILAEYRHAVERYGAPRAQRLFEVMLKHYRYFMLIDTGAYDVAGCRDQALALAQNTGRELVVAQGGTWFLQKLLTGPHDDDFCVIPRGGVVESGNFGLAGQVTARQVM